MKLTNIVASCIMTISILLLSGCQINPTPKGYTNGKFSEDFTIDIVNHIQCEIRDALVTFASGLIFESEMRDDIDFPGAESVAATLAVDPSRASTFKAWQIDPRAYVQALLFLKSQIGLTFDLTAKETNTVSIDPTFNASGGPHSLSLGIQSHSIAVERQNQRKLTKLDADFSSYTAKSCYYDPEKGNRNPPKENWIYPMNGRIELDKTLKTFIRYVLNDITEDTRYQWADAAISSVLAKATDSRLTSTEDLVLYAKKINSECNNPNSETCKTDKLCYESILNRAGNTYVSLFNGTKKTSELKFDDVLMFTSTIGGGIAPNVTLTPGTGSFKLKMLAGGFSGTRIDTHMLTIALAADTFDPPAKNTKTINIGGNSEAKLIVNIPGSEKTIDAIEACLPENANTPQGKIAILRQNEIVSKQIEEKQERESEALLQQLEDARDDGREAELIRSLN